VLIIVRVNEHQPASYAESLSFLVSQVGARSAQLFAERLAPLGVSPRAFGVLSNLGSTGGQTQQQLADTLGIHRNNMVGLIDELEAAGWVRRHRSQRDRRAFDVRLTRAGSALVARISTLIPGLDAEVGQDLTDSEQRTMVALLQQIASTLDLRPGIHPGLSASSRTTRPHPDHPVARARPLDAAASD
jgi:DNA-binding MarR family transcriptional regulator